MTTTKPKLSLIKIFRYSDIFWITLSITLIAVLSFKTRDFQNFVVWTIILIVVLYSYRWYKLRNDVLFLFGLFKEFNLRPFFKLPELNKSSVFKLNSEYTHLEHYRSALELIELFVLKIPAKEIESSGYTSYTYILFKTSLNQSYPFVQAIYNKSSILDFYKSKPKKINTESKQFNENYLVKYKIPQDAFYVLNPKVIDLLNESKGNYCLEVDKNYAVLFATYLLEDYSEYEEMWNLILKIKDALE